MVYPRYRSLYENGVLEDRIRLFRQHYSECSLCPHKCKVNRQRGERGVCRAGTVAVVASYNCHDGEEPPISGTSGSGTIFFTWCSGKCLFCQNYPISQLGIGREVTDEELADMMMSLQSRGCININLVTPTHFLPSFLSALSIAIDKGFSLPIVYNTSGYERVETLRLLDSIIDIYLPDAKYSDSNIARKLSGFTNYVGHNRSALMEMYRQVGNLRIRDGNAIGGMIIRHLVLPGNLSGTDEVLTFIAEGISRDMYTSLMNQYFPAHKAVGHPLLSRKITQDEYNWAIERFHACGLHNGWIQELTCDSVSL